MGTKRSFKVEEISNEALNVNIDESNKLKEDPKLQNKFDPDAF